MQKPRSVTLLQATWSVAATIIGVGILAFPRITVEYASTGAPLAAIAATIGIICFGLILAYLGKEYPEKTMFEYADLVIGKWIAGIFLLPIGLYYLVLAGLTAREFGEVVVTSVLQRTPLEVTVIIMLFLAASAARSDAGVLARILTFYMPFVYFPALVIVMLTLKSSQLSNIRPLLSFMHETNWMQLGHAMLVVMALFQNYLLIGLLTPFMYRPNLAWKSASMGIGVAGLLYVIIMYATLSVFGTEEIKNLLWPTLELAKTAAFPAFFVERLDPIFIAVWVTAVFTSILSFYYVSIQGFAHLFRFKNHKIWTTILFPIIFILAMQPPNVIEMYQIVERVGIAGLYLTLGYPAVLVVFHLVKKRRKKQKDQVNPA